MDGESKQINRISSPRSVTNNNNNNAGGSMMMMKERPQSTSTAGASTRPSTTATTTTVSRNSSRPETINNNYDTTLIATKPIIEDEAKPMLEKTDTLPPLDINLNGPSYMKMTEERKAQTITNQSSISYTPTKQLIPVYLIIIYLFIYYI